MENQTNPAYYNGLGHQCRERGQFSEAITHYANAIRLAPDNMDYYYNRAVCYRKCDQYENAVNDYSVVINNDPKDATALYERGICYNRINAYQKALNDFNIAISIRPSINIDCYLCRAAAYCGLGDGGGAAKDLNHVLSIDPGNPVASEMLSQIKQIEGKSATRTVPKIPFPEVTKQSVSIPELKGKFSTLTDTEKQREFIENLKSWVTNNKNKLSRERYNAYVALINDCTKVYNAILQSTGKVVKPTKSVKWEDINMKVFNEGMELHSEWEAKLGQYMQNVSNKTNDVMRFMKEKYPPVYLFALAFGGIAEAGRSGEPIDFHVQLLTASAERGFMPSQFILGNLCADGAGVPQDITKARYWWKKAADQELIDAKNRL
jgi:hypothetical protein